MGYPLYGAELTSETTPIEAGLKRFINLDSEDFIGKDVMVKADRRGSEKKLIGFEMTEKGIARGGYKIFAGGKEIGSVTSGTTRQPLKKPSAWATSRPDTVKSAVRYQ